MTSKITSYNLGRKVNVVTHEIVRKTHHLLAHLNNTDRDFVVFCKKICEVTRYFFNPKLEKKQDVSVSPALVRNRRQYLEEGIFEAVIKNHPFSGALDIVFTEDVEEGKVFLLDQAEHKLPNDKIIISHKKVELYEYYPDDFTLTQPRVVNIETVFKNLKYRADIHSKADNNVTSSSLREPDFETENGYNVRDFKKIYKEKSEAGDQLIQNLFHELKQTDNKDIPKDETKFYWFVSKLITKEARKWGKRFQKIQTIDEYVKWVSGDPSYSPKQLIATNKPNSEKFEVPHVDDNALIRFFGPNRNVVTDFHRAVALVKDARVFTLDDIKSRSVIFGGLRKDCQTLRKQYPFQDVFYLSNDSVGNALVNGLQSRKVEIVLPTISQMPHVNACATLNFRNENGEDDDEDYMSDSNINCVY